VTNNQLLTHTIGQVLNEMETDSCTAEVIESNNVLIREGRHHASTVLAGVIMADAERMEAGLEKATA
jgi:hypothetical protein